MTRRSRTCQSSTDGVSKMRFSARPNDASTRKCRPEDAVVVNDLIVTAVFERAVSGRRLVQQRRGALRARRAGRRVAKKRGVESMRRRRLPRAFARRSSRCADRDRHRQVTAREIRPAPRTSSSPTADRSAPKKNSRLRRIGPPIVAPTSLRREATVLTVPSMLWTVV